MSEARNSANAPNFSVFGIDHWLLVSGDESGGQFEVFEMRGDPGMGVPPHDHVHEDENFFVLEGQVAFIIDGEKRVLGPGNSVFFKRGVSHGFTFLEGSQVRLLLTVAPSNLQPMFERLAALPPGPPDFEEVVRICSDYRIAFTPAPDSA